ncbi:MAG: DUF5989 family protein [Planctomycetota bacterium]|jgi:flagellar biosynthesis/type III secretory pathway M-ring protein FliF/YscJ
MSKIGIFKEFWIFLKQEKKWWLIPLVAVLVILGVFLAFSSTSPLAPWLYPLF